MEDLSFGEDPSILACNKPLQQKHLNFEEAEEDAANVKVYLRVRPKTNDESIKFIIREKSIQVKAVKTEKLKEFSFSHVFPEGAKQSEIYHTCVKKLVSQFINGNDSTIMAYGTSGAGKTHTMLGTIQSPGIVPRVLFNIFKILPLAPDSILLKPNENLEIVSLTPKFVEKEKMMKQQLLKLCEKKKRRSLFSYSSMHNLLSAASDTSDSGMISGIVHYTIWISFAEIYNEYIYDLLDTNASVKGKDRVKLKLCENKYSSSYIKGLTKINIRNGDEAYKILRYGQRNLHYAATKINSTSSRSHCIFTLYLVKADEDTAFISHLNFCDLAGSERVVNTQHTGQLLKEAQSINTSLHVLGKCLKTIQENQMTRGPGTIVPYRESKLTRLFHRALLGQERLSLLVNVNPKQIFYEETMNSLNFASIAKEIVLDKDRCNRKSKVRVSTCFKGLPTSTICENIIEIDCDSNDESEDDKITVDEIFALLEERDSKINELEMKLEIEEAKWKQQMEDNEREVRQELVENFRAMLSENEKRYEKRIKDLKERYQLKIEELKLQLEDYINKEENCTDDDSSENEVEITTNFIL